jgi:hypothetical protein
MSDITRRFAVLSAGASLVAAMPAPANAAAGSDAELLALEQQFEPLYAEYLALRTHAHAIHDQIESSMKARSTSLGARVMWGEQVESAAAARQALCALFDSDDILGRCEALDEAIFPIADAIDSVNAATLAGLAVKARSAAYACSELWEETLFAADDLHKAVIRSLIENVCAAGGRPHPAAPAVRQSTAVPHPRGV